MGNARLLSAYTGPPGNQGLTYVLQSLITGATGGLALQDDGGTGNGSGGTAPFQTGWQTDGTGGFFRLSYNNPGTFGLRWGFATTGVHQIYIRYDMRRWFSPCSKGMKQYGWGLINTGNYSNSTWGPAAGGYSGTDMTVVYGDFVTGSNDATVGMAMSGYPTNNLPNIGFGDSFSRTPYPTQSITNSVTQNIAGVWETWEIFCKYSDPATNNGEFALWKNLSTNPQFWLTNAWNCSSTTQDRGGMGLGEFSPNSGFYEDYRNLYVSFQRPTGRGI